MRCDARVSDDELETLAGWNRPVPSRTKDAGRVSARAWPEIGGGFLLIRGWLAGHFWRAERGTARGGEA